MAAQQKVTFEDVEKKRRAFSSSLPDFRKTKGQDLSQVNDPAIQVELGSETCRIKSQIGDISETIGRLPDAFFDMVYVNGDHSYDAAQRAIAMLHPKMKPDGALVFHSYTTWSAVTMYHCGVARAVHEFCLENPWKFRYLALESMMYNDVMIVPEGQAGHE